MKQDRKITLWDEGPPITVTGKIKGGTIKQASWKDIQRCKYPEQYRSLWLSGFLYGLLTFAIMSGLVYLAWRGF